MYSEDSSHLILLLLYVGVGAAFLAFVFILIATIAF